MWVLNSLNLFALFRVLRRVDMQLLSKRSYLLKLSGFLFLSGLLQILLRAALQQGCPLGGIIRVLAFKSVVVLHRFNHILHLLKLMLLSLFVTVESRRFSSRNMRLRFSLVLIYCIGELFKLGRGYLSRFKNHIFGWRLKINKSA